MNSKAFGQIILWIVLAAVLALAGLAVVGAFLGATAATTIFNSLPMTFAWLALIALLLSAVGFSKVRRSPAGLALHLGPALIIIGAMLGSDRGHQLAQQYLGRQKIPHGFVSLAPGTMSREVRDGFTESGPLLGELPFDIRLDRSWIEYYDPDAPWQLSLADQDFGLPSGRQTPLSWKTGQQIPLGDPSCNLTVLEYLPHARAILAADTTAALAVFPAGQQPATLPLEVNKVLRLSQPEVTLRVARVFTHLRVSTGPTGEPLFENNSPQPKRAAEIEMTFADGRKDTVLVRQSRRNTVATAGLELRFAPAPIASATLDPSSDRPAMKVRIARSQQERTAWLAPVATSRTGWLDLADIFHDLGVTAKLNAPQPVLLLDEPPRTVKQFNSEITILDGGRAVAGGLIQVNRPFHWGGYHIYPYEFGPRGQEVTLMVKSDSGLWLVYAGMALCCAGVLRAMWAHPTIAFFRRREAHGHQA